MNGDLRTPFKLDKTPINLFFFFCPGQVDFFLYVATAESSQIQGARK